MILVISLGVIAYIIAGVYAMMLIVRITGIKLPAGPTIFWSVGLWPVLLGAAAVVKIMDSGADWINKRALSDESEKTKPAAQ